MSIPPAACNASVGAVSTATAALASPPASAKLAGPVPTLLWSAGNRIKYKINERYFGSHYVWCSPVFEAAALPRLATGAGQPDSSDPATIYRKLHSEVERGDKHSAEIARQRDSIKSGAVLLESLGKISTATAAEVSAIVDAAEISDFVPMLYVIPYSLVAARVQLVPYDKRASMDPEYIIPDLLSTEFQMIEPWPCLSRR